MALVGLIPSASVTPLVLDSLGTLDALAIGGGDRGGSGKQQQPSSQRHNTPNCRQLISRWGSQGVRTRRQLIKFKNPRMGLAAALRVILGREEVEFEGDVEERKDDMRHMTRHQW